MNENVNVAECLASERNVELQSTEKELLSLNKVVDDLRSECESWKAEAQHAQQQLKVRMQLSI